MADFSLKTFVSIQIAVLFVLIIGYLFEIQDLPFLNNSSNVANAKCSPPCEGNYKINHDLPKDLKSFKDIWPPYITAFWTPGMRTSLSPCPALPNVDKWKSTEILPYLSDDGKQTKDISNTDCRVSIEYVPSPIEQYWVDNIMNIADFGGGPSMDKGWGCGCEHLKAGLPFIDHWLDFWKNQNDIFVNGSTHSIEGKSSVFSYHLYQQECGTSKKVIARVPIEPLLGILRHPLYWCFPERVTNINWVYSKDYMLSTSRDYIFPSLTSEVKQHHSYFFDIGASLYGAGYPSNFNSVTSTKWFIDSYARKGIHFDRIICWVPSAFNPSVYFDSVPPDTMSRISFFNVAPSIDADGALNPWRMLKSIVKPGDFVAARVNVHGTSQALINQIGNDKELNATIDHLWADGVKSPDMGRLRRPPPPPPSPTPHVPQSYLFDLGASTYQQGAGGASQSWFVDTYAARGITFDRIFGWEPIVVHPIKVVTYMPSHIVDVMSYFNTFADPIPGAKHNPLRILASVTHPDDFVVIKIDIDNSEVETTLVNQILSNKTISSRIDELYYEHHVTSSPVQWGHWRWATGKDATIENSYTNFTKLRKLGIRAHAWV